MGEDCSKNAVTTELIENLKRRGFNVFFYKNGEDAVSGILELIKQSESVAFGGSETAKQLKLPENLKDRGNTVLHRMFLSKNDAQTDILRDSIFADWYVCSVNALTSDGLLVNTDGTANRIAATLYGPKNVLFVVGANKICNDLDSAFERIRKIAAPKNCIRLGKDNPCVHGGSCRDCDPKNTICKATVIHSHPTTGKNCCVVLIEQNLGY